MINLLVTFAILVIASVVVYLLSKHLSQKAAAVKDADTASIKQEIYHLDQSIKKSLTKLSSMVSLDEKIEVQTVLNDQQVAIEAESSRIEAIQEKLKNLRAVVEKQEEKVAQLKKGKDESFRLAEEVRAKSDQLESERARLEAELSNSKDQMIALKSELELTSEQSAAVDEIYKSIDEAATRLQDLSESHQISSDRFLNLQIQYEELEKEYSKLIAKELNPD